jgi:hypothetical protein
MRYEELDAFEFRCDFCSRIFDVEDATCCSECEAEGCYICIEQESACCDKGG